MTNYDTLKEYEAHGEILPSYDEWINIQKEIQKKSYDLGNLGYKIKNQRKEIERQITQNTELKELLKDCKKYISNIPVEDKSKYMVNAINLLRSIDGVLK